MCVNIDESNYLEADLRVTCDDDTYKMYTVLGCISMAIYPFGVPLVFLGILARHSDDELYLDEDIEARKAAVGKQLQALMCSSQMIEGDEITDERARLFLAAGAQHDQEKAQQRRTALEAELHEIEQVMARHQRAVQVYGFIFAQYRSHAWYWEAGILFVTIGTSILLTALFAVDMVFKVLVIGVIVFVPRSVQLAYVFLVTLAFLVFSSSVQPYKANRDNSFE